MTGRSAEARPAGKPKSGETLAQSVYLFSIISATVGWVWLLTSIAVEMLS